MNAGTSTSTIVAPAAASASNACSVRSTTSGSAPSRQVGDAADAQTLDAAVEHGRSSRAAARGSTSSRSGRGRAMTSQRERGVGDGVRERPDLVEAAGERDQPVAADAAVRRLDADHAAQRRRLADRAAGVGAERRAARTRRRPPPPTPPLDPPGTRLVSSGLRVGPNAEFSVLDPIANSSRLVLPIEDRAGRLQAGRRSWRRTAASSPRGSSTSTSSARRACTCCP